MGDWIDVVAAEELKPGRCHVVELDDGPVAVFNLDGEYFAIEDICSHDYAQLSEGNLDGGEITCPLHGARFDVRTGEALSAPAYEPVATFSVRVEGGMLQIKDERV